MSLGAKSKTSSSLRVSVTNQHCTTMTKSPRQMPTKHNSLPNWSKDIWALDIESKHFDSNHFSEVNKFIENNCKYFILLKNQMATGLT